MKRRTFLKSAAAMAAASSLAPVRGAFAQDAAAFKPIWSMFGRHLQWVVTEAESLSDPYGTGVKVGEAALEAGFDWADIPVRRGGLVPPELVGENLAPMIEGIRSTGSECKRITAAITPPTDPEATGWWEEQLVEPIFRTAGENGVEYCRVGTTAYEPDTYGDEIIAQLDGMKLHMQRLAELGQETGVNSVYHTWNRTRQPDISTSVWDLVYVLEGLPPYVGFNFDIGHMFKDGPLSSWKLNLRYALPYIKSMSLMDVTYDYDPRTESWSSVVVDSGKGMIPFQEVFDILHDGGFDGHFSLQVEHTGQGANGTLNMNTTFWADHEEFTNGNATRDVMIGAFARQLQFYKENAERAGFVI
ncbi:sugar phosphate isomerase/epimerase family protein [Pelagibacterium halotolerans]|uniref:sugar phosphate isomerase/epimerase family protein n=1 Tax=Pelagibacterium halotolerans TaxID=531813 RepID=UPI0008963BCD|nr:TIM barrel protein [Pelagibacterium halotolerans]QJR18916.1 sugar phosphate isomerase/epimerase [Pelagibacterium halotolerans]SEA67981.1 Sugar phosphate isomerase/epimerase [Pelagibacterium halotolerans]